MVRPASPSSGSASFVSGAYIFLVICNNSYSVPYFSVRVVLVFYVIVRGFVILLVVGFLGA